MPAFVLVLFSYLRFCAVIEVRRTNARALERPVLLPPSMTARLLFEPEDGVPEKFFVLDSRGLGKTASGGGG